MTPSTHATSGRHDLFWFPCPTCWGQRRVLGPAPNGEGLVGETCPGCLGVGEHAAHRE